MKASPTQNILNSPLTKIIIGLIVCIVTVRFGQMAILKLLELTSIDKELQRVIGGVAVAVLAIISYHYLYSFYEKRKITELSTNGLINNLGTGFLIGATLQSLTILVIYLKGGYSVISVNPILFIVPALIKAFTAAIFEEILLRGIVFRIAEEKLGSYFSMAISAVLFGAMHLANPHSSLIAGVGIAIQAGLLLAAAYMYTRNLWFPIAIHFAWNFTQSAIFGANVSGNTISKTLITSRIEGAEWFTGGLFGPEGSIQATVFCLMATIILLVLCHREGKIIAPYWKKNDIVLGPAYL
jgi:membrane protease YdiL (CAAX protease family)